jgi:dTDP-4-dehydrorhamnose 3,5-epimerase
MHALPTELTDVLIVEPEPIADARGFFMEVWHAGKYRGLGIDSAFVQENHSRSRRGTIRGLHYQTHEPQGKLVRVVHGTIFDVAVDLRRSSGTFGRWFGVELSRENQRMLWIPPGCAHGFAVTSDAADVVYLCTTHHAADSGQTLQWNDPRLGISWPLDGRSAILSPRDAAGLPFDRAPLFP